MIEIHLINSISVDMEPCLYYDNDDDINFDKDGVWIRQINREQRNVINTFIPYSNIKYYKHTANLT